MAFPKNKKPASKRVLEDWVLEYGQQNGSNPGRVARTIAFTALGQVLQYSAAGTSEQFIVKGGVAIELRMKGRPRTTQDIDAIFLGDFDEWLLRLDLLLRQQVEGFSFERKGGPRPLGPTGAYRVMIQVFYNSKIFRTVPLEVSGVEAEDFLLPEALEAFDLRQFGFEQMRPIYVVSLAHATAQKLHACTERSPDRDNDRVRDIPDLLFIRDELAAEELSQTKKACHEVFRSRGKQKWPPKLDIPDNWRDIYPLLAEENDLPIDDLNQAVQEVNEFIKAIDQSA